MLAAETLTPLALADQLLGIVQSSRPEETMAESFGNEGSGGGMVATFTLVDVSEDSNALLRLKVMLEDASRAAPDELSIDDRVCSRPALHLPGQDFVSW
jgi:hypothetical protein